MWRIGLHTKLAFSYQNVYVCILHIPAARRGSSSQQALSKEITQAYNNVWHRHPAGSSPFPSINLTITPNHRQIQHRSTDGIKRTGLWHEAEMCYLKLNMSEGLALPFGKAHTTRMKGEQKALKYTRVLYCMFKSSEQTVTHKQEMYSRAARVMTGWWWKQLEKADPAANERTECNVRATVAIKWSVGLMSTLKPYHLRNK